ncbi:ATP-binding protein [Pseudanabaena yagii]|uniref:ATP-binding protein n=1 Tax=Pseudanabaena yagii TaxID=2661615 RepID=UPI001B7D2339|nr:ATP-binding protein [Pseudanabaena yagii]
MANKSSKKGEDKNQLSLFDIATEGNSTLIERSKDDLSQSSLTNSLLNTQADKNNLEIIEDSVLFLPETYESIVKKIGRDNAELANFVIPVTQFEKEIIQILADISTAGYLVFLYGVSGVGKSTFTGSLKFQKYIPVQKIVSIDATTLDRNTDQPKLKLLLETIRLESESFFKDHDEQASNDKLCIVIEYLENLEDEDQNKVIAFFRDLNQFLRKYGVLIIWPVTERSYLEKMQNYAKSFSSTIFHDRTPSIDFTGPSIDDYPTIAKKTIMFFNGGKSCYEFQLNDDELEKLKQDYLKKPKEKHLIRDYLRDVKKLWQRRTNYLAKVVSNIPKPMEVWFIFSYPHAEGVVAGFAKKTPDIPNEMWNADYRSLNAYINDNNQRKATWNSERLTFALTSTMLTTKIMYLPTNALISCIASYGRDANLKINKDELLDKDKFNIPEAWFNKYAAKKALKSTPLYLQILELQTSANPTSLGKPKFTAGKRKSGKVVEGLKNATKAFEKFNERISAKNSQRISDNSLNKSLCLALKDLLEEYDNISLDSEQFHPYLNNIKPDILIEMEEKIICVEMCYTNDNTPGYLADYVLKKLNTYMTQLQSKFGIDPALKN